MEIVQTRRHFLTRLSLAGVAGLLPSPAVAAEEPPEMTSVRLMRTPSICHAPQFVAEDLLQAEGFTDVQYIEGIYRRDQRGGRQRKGGFQHALCPTMGVGYRRRRGGHRSIRRACRLLRTVRERGHPQHCRSQRQDRGCCCSRIERPPVCVGYSCPYRARPCQRYPLGHQPVTDTGRAVRGGQNRCLSRLPPVPQDLRARHIGHVVVNSAMDRPWSQYFCCMLAGNREYVRKYPVATKRVCARS